jgi:hypothetical protein
MWIYSPGSGGTFNIGFYVGSKFVNVTSETTEAAAQALVSYLNGGTAPT